MNARSGRSLAVLLIAVAAFSLWMRAGFPVYGIRGSYADDGLFLRLAQSIGQGRWLGPFDDLTLAKGPAYPAFIAAAATLHMPLKMAEQVCLILASAVLCRWIALHEVAGRRSAGHVALGSILFVLLCLNPIIWTASLARVIREGLYISLSLAVVALTLHAGFPGRDARLGGALRSGIGLGLVGSAFWLTREEGLWLVPSLAIVVGVAALGEFAKWRSGRQATAPTQAAPEPLAWRQATSFICAGLVCAAVFGVVATINRDHYGEFELTEVKSSAFTHAYGALSRIEPDRWQRYLVFPKDVRERAYAVSPAAHELAPILEGPSGQNLAMVHCGEYLITPCTGFHAGWFQWILREAVKDAGHYGSAKQARMFYQQLAREIDKACDMHRLRCLPARNDLAPPFRWEYLGDTLHEAWSMFKLFVTLGTTQIGHLPSEAIGGDIDAIADLVGPVQPGATKAMYIHGWAATLGRTPSLSVASHQEDGRYSASVDLVPQGDVNLLHPGLHAAEFTINTTCPRQDCDLLLGVPGQADIRLPISSLIKNTMPLDGVSRLFVDSVEEAQTFPFSTRLQNVQLKIADWSAAPYRAARFLWPFALASLALAFVLDARRPKPLALYALALASLAAVISRVGLLSYLQITSIPSRNLLYLSPATPFLIILIVTALFLGGQSVARTLREHRTNSASPSARAPD